MEPSINPGSSVRLTRDEVRALSKEWSLKDDILGKDVYNESNEDIGTIEDLLVTRDKAISYAIIGVGGFLGMGRHDVAVPVNQLQVSDGHIVLPRVTKETLKAMPAFERS